jgi:hypothetical protein
MTIILGPHLEDCGVPSPSCSLLKDPLNIVDLAALLEFREFVISRQYYLEPSNCEQPSAEF